jgi:hypothetical protein
MQSLEHLPRTATPEAVAQILKRDGAAIIDNLLPDAERTALNAELAPWMENTPFGPDEFSGRRTRRTGALIARSPKCRELIQNPLILGTAGNLLSHATSFRLHLTQVIAIGPGEPAQAIHRDQWAFDFFPFPKEFDVQCNTIWALTDFTAENGATRVIPRSNHFDDRLQFQEEDTIPAEMSAGSVLVYSGSVYHGGGANRSDAVRVGLNLTYCLSWLRQEENQYLSVPLEIARTLPDDLLRLMGYSRGAFALGYVDDLRDPLEVVRASATHIGLGDDLAAAQARLRQGYAVAAGE